jgi:hypothetical protein
MQEGEVSKLEARLFGEKTGHKGAPEGAQGGSH